MKKVKMANAAVLNAAVLAALACTTTLTSAAEQVELNDIVVTAARVPQLKESVIADVTVIESEDIQRAGQSTFVELLQMRPGIEISSNGGPGSTSSIFMRGTNAGHVVVLVDGMRMMSATAGTATWENIPLGIIERVEILRGPATSLYGQDAIGGVIQIFTKKGVEQTKFYANLGVGAYQTTKADAGVYGRVHDTRYAFSLASSDNEGFSALNSHQANIKDDDAYRNLAFSANVSQQLAEGHEMGVQIFNSDGWSHFDNGFNLTNFSSKTRVNQQSVAFTSNNRWATFWLSTLRVGFSRDKSKNTDESDVIPQRFDTEQTQISWQNDLTLPVGTLSLLYEGLEDDVTSTTKFDLTNRTNHALVASYLANVGVQSIQLSLRKDHNSQFGDETTGSIGYGVSFNEHWRAKASYGTAFKAPTFNDLYYPFTDFGFGFSYQGNPNLKPEKSRNQELSVAYQNDGSRLSATMFRNKINNLILGSQNIPADTSINLGSVTIKGLSLSGQQSMGHLALGASVDIQSPRDDASGDLLVRRANRQAKLNLDYDWHDWRFGAEMLSTSARYNDKANTTRLGGYSLVNLTAAYHVNQDWTVQARLNNVLDKQYVLAYDFSQIAYNNPGANLFVNIRYQPE